MMCEEMETEQIYTLDENEIHYICENNGFIIDPSSFGNDFGNACGGDDENGAMFLNGQCLLTDDGHTILLPNAENEVQYYINDDTDTNGLVIGTEDDVYQATQVLQIVDDQPPNQVVYYTEDKGGFRELTSEEMSQIAIMQVPENYTNVVNLDNGSNKAEHSQQYAIIGDLSGQLYTAVTEEESAQEEPEVIDASKITGRNLITGQVVTLENYLEKLKKKDKDDGKKQGKSKTKEGKVASGQTSGKKLVGKILHIKKKDIVETVETHDHSYDQAPKSNKSKEDKPVKDDPKPMDSTDLLKSINQREILLTKCPTDEQTLESISKTLSGLMEMETIRKKLENLNIFIKVVEKAYHRQSNAYIKSIAYSFGCMEKTIDENETENWEYIPYRTPGGVDGKTEQTDSKYLCTTNLTILITYMKTGKKTIRVNLNSNSQNICPMCFQNFHSNLQLHGHILVEHTNHYCPECQSGDDWWSLKKHREQHLSEGKLLCCPLCVRSFSTEAKVEQHLSAAHDTLDESKNPNTCPVCGKTFADDSELHFHRKSHQNERHFACNVCLRTFSRHSNLLRHMEIHKGKGAAYKCEICCCSYNYMSSLTRHMVQVHINSTDVTATNSS